MAVVTRTTVWVDGNVLTAAALNSEFNNLLNALGITNADIATGAAIAYSKLNLAGFVTNNDIANNAGIVASKLAITFPSGTIVGTTDSQVLSSKTLTKPTINASVQGVTTDVDGATITFDMSLTNIHRVQLAGNRTLAVTNVSVGQSFVVDLINGGNNVVTWFGGIKWPGNSVPVLTTTSGKVDSFGFLCTANGSYQGYILGQNL